MIVFLKNVAFVCLIFLANLPENIKAMDSILSEESSLLSNPFYYMKENESSNIAHLKNRDNVKNNKAEECRQRTIRFRNNVNKAALEFENFDSLSTQEQQQLLDKWERRVSNWIYEIHLVRYNMVDEPFQVSDETRRKVKWMHRYYPQKKHSCNIF